MTSHCHLQLICPVTCVAASCAKLPSFRSRQDPPDCSLHVLLDVSPTNSQRRPHAQVTASAWEPLASLRTLSLSMPRSLSRDSADNILRACGALRTLRLQFPAGSVDTAYLARHADNCESLQLLEVTAQRMLFTKTLGGGATGTGAGTAHHI